MCKRCRAWFENISAPLFCTVCAVRGINPYVVPPYFREAPVRVRIFVFEV